jgi:hypothetical protein
MIFGRDDYNNRIIDKDNKIPQDEPVFFLRGKDKFAPELLLLWAMKLRLSGGDPILARNAEDHAQLMLEYQKINGTKTPDYVSNKEVRNQLISKFNSILGNLNNDNVHEIKWILKELFGGPASKDWMAILMNSDLSQSSISKPFDSIQLSDFNLDVINFITKYKLVLFVQGSKWKVIVNNVSNENTI